VSSWFLDVEEQDPFLEERSADLDLDLALMVVEADTEDLLGEDRFLLCDEDSPMKEK